MGTIQQPAPVSERTGRADDASVGAALVSDLAAWMDDRGIATPVFGFVGPVLRPSVERLHDELGARVSYSTKANSHPLALRDLAGLVDEFNVTNLAHLDAVLEAGVEPARVAWVHPVLTTDLLSALLSRGVRRFVVDDRRGLDLLSASGADVALTLRLLPPDTGESERSVVRFGNDAAALRDLARRAAGQGLEFEALSFFVGTDGAGMDEALPFRRGLEALARMHGDLRDDGITVGTVNIGGGFPGSRRRFHVDHPSFFRKISDAVEAELGPGVSLLCEPGRYLAEPTLVMLTRVVADRVLAGRRLVSVDASAYAGMFESTFIDPDDGLTIWSEERPGEPSPAELLGPVMDSFDVLRKGGMLPPLREGDLLAVPNVGAYSVGYATTCEGLAAPGIVALPETLAGALSERWFA